MLNRKNITHLISVSSLLLGYVFANSNTAFANPVRGKFDSIKIAQTSQQGESNTPVAVEENDIKFLFKGCLRKNKVVSCNFLITNTDNTNRWFRLNWMGKSRVIDANGNQFDVKLVTMAGEKPSMSHSQNTLVPDVPIKASFILELPQQVNNFAVLEIEYQTNEKLNTIPFRNIKVSSTSPNQ